MRRIADIASIDIARSKSADAATKGGTKLGDLHDAALRDLEEAGRVPKA